MPTLFTVYNLIENQNDGEYGNYLIETKIPGLRGAPFIANFKTWKIDKVLGPAVSEPEGELPAEPPYSYVAKIEVSDLDAMLSFTGPMQAKILLGLGACLSNQQRSSPSDTKFSCVSKSYKRIGPYFFLKLAGTYLNALVHLIYATCNSQLFLSPSPAF